MISVLSIIEDTMVDGPGFRTSIYCAGCRHACPGCHNPQSWDFSGGRAMTTEEIMRVIVADPYANVTFSGGDPSSCPTTWGASTTKWRWWCASAGWARTSLSALPSKMFC